MKKSMTLTMTNMGMKLKILSNRLVVKMRFTFFEDSTVEEEDQDTSSKLSNVSILIFQNWELKFAFYLRVDFSFLHNLKINY